jgi:hypothetical protein
MDNINTEQSTTYELFYLDQVFKNLKWLEHLHTTKRIQNEKKFLQIRDCINIIDEQRQQLVKLDIKDQ